MNHDRTICARLRRVQAIFLLAVVTTALLLMPQTAQAQNAPTITNTDTAETVAENTPITTAIETYTATDADMDTLTWSLEGDDAEDFEIEETSGVLTFKVVPDFEDPKGTPAMAGDDPDNTYEITIKVSDDESTPMSATLAVVVTVTDVNEKPVVSSGDTAITKAENTAISEVLATYTATDEDVPAQTLSWSLDGDDKDDFTLTENTDQTGYELKFKNVPNFEMPTDSFESPDTEGDNDYKIKINVTDSGSPAMTGTRDVTVTVTNVDEAGTVTITGDLDGGEELTATVTDLDGPITSGSLRWQWSSSDTSDGTFTNISTATGDKYTSVAVDVGKFLKAKATYKDPESTTEDKTAEAVTGSAIAASNAEPMFSDETATRTLPENSGAGVNVVGGTITATDGDSDTLTYSLASTGDHASFEIDSSGQIKAKSGVMHSFDFESTKKSYSITVQVSDGKDAASDTEDPAGIDDTIAVTINLTNVNEPPEITTNSDADKARTFNEIEFDVPNADLTAASYLVHTYTADDPDDGATLAWTLSGTDAASFTIDAMGKLSFKAKAMDSDPNRPDFENPHDVADSMSMGAEDNVYKLTVEVKDSLDDNGTSDTAVDDMVEVTVTVANVDEKPEITDGDAAVDFVEIAYDLPSGDENLEVERFTARDEEDEAITWSLEGDDASDFTITKDTTSEEGVLAFNSRPNFEMPTDRANTMEGYLAGDNKYQIIVKATDGTGCG